MGVYVDVCFVSFSLSLAKASKIQSAGASTKRSLKLEDYDSANTNFHAMTARVAALNPLSGVEQPPALPTPKASTHTTEEAGWAEEGFKDRFARVDW